MASGSQGERLHEYSLHPGQMLQVGQDTYVLMETNQAKVAAWGEDQGFCEVCKYDGGDDGEEECVLKRGTLLECYRCLAAAHTLCLTIPLLDGVPEDDWYCEACALWRATGEGEGPKPVLRAACQRLLFSEPPSSRLALVRIAGIVRNRLGEGGVDIFAQYYVLPQETLQGRDESVHHPREVFLTSLAFFESVDSIYRPAVVVPMGQLDATDGNDVFGCSRAYDMARNVFVPLGAVVEAGQRSVEGCPTKWEQRLKAATKALLARSPGPGLDAEGGEGVPEVGQLAGQQDRSALRWPEAASALERDCESSHSTPERGALPMLTDSLLCNVSHAAAAAAAATAAPHVVSRALAGERGGPVPSGESLGGAASALLLLGGCTSTEPQAVAPTSSTARAASTVCVSREEPSGVRRPAVPPPHVAAFPPPSAGATLASYFLNAQLSPASAAPSPAPSSPPASSSAAPPLTGGPAALPHGGAAGV